jgi:hypothetical protein
MLLDNSEEFRKNTGVSFDQPGSYSSINDSRLDMLE